MDETGRQRLIWYPPRIGGEAVSQLKMLAAIGNQFRRPSDLQRD